MAIKERFSNFELLRIICMVLIVMHHLSMHGSYEITATSSTFNEGVLNFFVIGGKLGANVFIFISGYFLINSKFKIKKVIKLILQVLFYALGIYFLFIVIGEQEFSWNLLLYNLFPISTRRYWFMTWYVVLYLLSPLLNKLLKKLSKVKHKNLILVLLLVQILMIPLTFQVNGVGEGPWVITLYIIGSYIRLHDDKMFRYFLWDDLLQVNAHFQQSTFIVFAVISVVLIFVGCASFEYIRQNTIGRLEDLVLSKFRRKENVVTRIE